MTHGERLPRRHTRSPIDRLDYILGWVPALGFAVAKNGTRLGRDEAALARLTKIGGSVDDRSNAAGTGRPPWDRILDCGKLSHQAEHLAMLVRPSVLELACLAVPENSTDWTMGSGFAKRSE